MRGKQCSSLIFYDISPLIATRVSSPTVAVVHVGRKRKARQRSGVNKTSELAIFTLICLIREHLSDPLWSCHLGPLHSQLIPITEEDRSHITEAEELLSQSVCACACERLIVHEGGGRRKEVQGPSGRGQLWERRYEGGRQRNNTLMSNKGKQPLHP